MSEELMEAPFLFNIGFLITYKCQISCPHCILEAGPHRKEEMKREDIFNWIEQTARYRDRHIKTACITGGEPFYDIKKLKELFSLLYSNGLLPSVVTNAFWAESMEIALQILKEMPELKVISVSTDEYHQSQISFEKVKNALLAAKELGLVYDTAVCTEDKNDLEYKKLLDQLEKIIDKKKINTVLTFPAGRALKKIEPDKYEMVDEAPIGACSSANTPTIFPNGNVFACIGPVIDLSIDHPLYLGNLNEKPLAKILDEAELNVILQTLRLWGPNGLLKLLIKKGYDGALPKKFVKNIICDLCYNMMKDEKLCAAMTELQQDINLMEETAYARVYYLNETRMIEIMNEKGLLNNSTGIIS